MGIIENHLKTGVLLAALAALFLWIGNYFGGSSGLAIAFVFVLAMNFAMYFYSDKIVLAMYRAKKLSSGSKIYGLVKNVALKSGLPMPEVYIIPSKSPNAFATGRSPKHSSVALTEGIIDLLDSDELEAVIAHELGHIKNRDTLITTIAATIAGIIAYAASMARWAAFFGYSDRDNDSSLLELLFLAFFAPLIATLLQLAISRQREYLADAASAKITGQPKNLAKALKKISQGINIYPMALGNKATSALFIENPFKGGFLSLFSTHPPIKERIRRLENMQARK